MDKIKNQSANKIKNKSLTFWKFFRLVFVMFSLYLMGDTFYRWDGFKFHSSFYEFLPSVALASIIWSILSILTAFLAWLPLRAFEQLFKDTGLKIKAEHLILYLGVFVTLAAAAWTGKKLIWSDFPTTFQLKLTVIIFMLSTSMPLAWLFRNKAAPWISATQERITPLVWLFSFFVILSVPLAGFHTWEKNTDKVIQQKITQSTLSKSDKKRPNIILVTFDALTARNMSVYGYSRPTTPFIKKWAETASLFTRAEAESNYTAATTASLMTGKRVWTHRKYQHDIAAKPVMIDTENLAFKLKENGYYNLAFIANIITTVESIGVSRSFDIAPLVTEFSKPASIESIIERQLFLLFGNKFHIYNWLGQDDFIFTVLLRRIPQDIRVTEYPPELSFNKFLGVIDDYRREPFFAWIHVLPPHDPQLPPPPFSGTFDSSWEMREKNIQYSIRPEIKKYTDRNLPFPKELKRKVELLRNYYDEFILFCDKQFEDFIGKLQKRSWLENTVIILSSDHGDSFEHNYFLHNGPHLYEQVTHIPLIIKEPGQTERRIINKLAEQIDIPATILDLANISIPSWMEGRSLLPLLRNREIPSKTAISVNLFRNLPADPITTGSIAIWKGDYKLIHYLDNGKLVLFNLKKDPDELNNLFHKEPEIGQRLLGIINDSLKDANERIMTGKQENLY